MRVFGLLNGRRNIFNGYSKHQSTQNGYDDKGNKIKHIYKTSGGETYETNYRNNALHGEKVNRDYYGNVIKSEFFYESNGKTKPVTKEEFDNLTKNEKK